MADNTTLDAGTGGDIIASASLTFSGDTAKVQAIGVGLLSGSEGSWTYSLLVGGAGAVAAGVQRVTLASDDPAVTSLQLLDDAVFAEDVAAQVADKGVSVLAVRRDTASSMVGADNDYTNLIVDSSGRLHVNVGNTVTVTGAGGTFPVTDSGGSLTVDAPVGTPVFVQLSDGAAPITTLPVSLASVPSHAVTNVGTFAVQVTSAPTTAVTGTFWQATQPVSVASLPSHDVTNVGTFLVQENGAALTSLQLIDDAVFAEDVAAQIADKGISVLAVRRDTASSMVGADNDYTNLIVDGVGRLHVNVGNSIAVGTVTAVTTVGTVTNLTQMAGATIQMDTGVRAPGCQRVTICTDDIVPASQSGTWNITNVSGTVSLPTGASSATNQTTIIGHLDGVEGLLTTIDGDTGSMLTSLQLLDDVVFAEDVAHSTGDKGIMPLAVRRDANTTLADTTGDYAPLQVDASGSLKVAIISGAGSGGTSATDDAAFSVASGSGTPIMGLADETGPDSVDEGDVGVVRMTLTRALHVNLRDAAGAELAVGGGTQYTEDAAATADPVGNVLNLIRDDARGGSLTTTDGDNVAARGTNAGELYVKHVDSIAVTGTFYQATQPVSLASVPSHAVTNAGTFAVQVDGSALTALQLLDDVVFAEDAAHTTGDKGVQVLTVRQDTAAALAGIDADYQPLITDASGRLHVNVGNTVTVASHAVTNAGTFAVQVDGAALTALQLIDDVVFAEDVAAQAADKGVAILAVRRDADTSLVGTDNDYANLQVDANGYLKVEVFDGGGSHTVDNNGTFAVQAAQSGTWNVTDVSGTVSLPTGASTAAKQPALGTAGTASTDVITIQGIASMTKLLVTPDANSAVNVAQINGVAVTMGNGASGTGVQRVTLANDSTGVVAATQSGTWDVGTVTTVTGVTTVSTVTTCSTVTTLANGQTAHDSAISGSPLRVGARAETALSGITLVADGDATDLYAGVDGVLITRPHCNLEDVVQERTTNTDGASTAFASGLAAPGAGVRLWIKNVTICNSSATFCTVDLRDGSGGSVLWTFPVPATGGVTHNFDPPLKLTANTALAFDASAATTTLSISANGFKSKV